MQVDYPANATFFQNLISVPWLCRGVIELAGCQSSVMADQQALQEFVDQYATELNDLTFNSKALVNTLTMLAGENVEAASCIAAAIEKHILTVRLQAQMSGGIHRISWPGHKHSVSLQLTHACLAVCTTPQALRSVSSGQHCEEHWDAIHHPIRQQHAAGLPQPPACLSVKASSVHMAHLSCIVRPCLLLSKQSDIPSIYTSFVQQRLNSTAFKST